MSHYLDWKMDWQVALGSVHLTLWKDSSGCLSPPQGGGYKVVSAVFAAALSSLSAELN